VYQYIPELLAVTRQHFGKITEQEIGIYQQIIEVHRSRLTASLPITGINLTDSGHPDNHIAFISLFIGCIGGRGNQMIIRIVNTCLYDSRLVFLLIQLHLPDDGTEQAFTVGRIINGKPGSESDILRFGTENAGKDGMESSHP